MNNVTLNEILWLLSDDSGGGAMKREGGDKWGCD